VLQGNPTPIAIRGVNRVMSTPQNLSDLPNTHLNDLKNGINLFDRPETFNVLAIAAPDLEYGGLPFELATVGDLFNSFVAGFQLARDIADMQTQKAMINTGPIGTGVFGNNIYMVWVLQVCAAQKVRLDLRFWSYSDETAKKAQEDYDAIKSEFDKGKDKTIAQLLKLASGSGLICAR
jgi:hypothetical protein